MDIQLNGYVGVAYSREYRIYTVLPRFIAAGSHSHKQLILAWIVSHALTTDHKQQTTHAAG